MALQLKIHGADRTVQELSMANPAPVIGPGGGLPVSGTVTVVQPTHDNLNANANMQVGNADISNANPIPTLGQVGLVTNPYDYIDCGYVAGNMTSVVYKTGGAGGATIATLALTYDGDGNLDTVTKT